jgi:hypothetical protein
MFVSRYQYRTYLKVLRHEKLFFVALHVTTQYKALGTVQKRIRLKKVLRVVSVDNTTSAFFATSYTVDIRFHLNVS